VITDDTTIGELATVLSSIRRPFRVTPQRVRGGGFAFTIQVEAAGGRATLTHESLGAVLDTAIALMRLNRSEQIAGAIADPEGARVGPAPTPDPTRVGYAQDAAHCAACGWGEEEGQQHWLGQPCLNCGSSAVCALPNGHDDGRHVPIVVAEVVE
jgi:hypothetical protein